MNLWRLTHAVILVAFGAGFICFVHVLSNEHDQAKLIWSAAATLVLLLASLVMAAANLDNSDVRDFTAGDDVCDVCHRPLSEHPDLEDEEGEEWRKGVR